MAVVSGKYVFCTTLLGLGVVESSGNSSLCHTLSKLNIFIVVFSLLFPTNILPKNWPKYVSWRFYCLLLCAHFEAYKLLLVFEE